MRLASFYALSLLLCGRPLFMRSASFYAVSLPIVYLEDRQISDDLSPQVVPPHIPGEQQPSLLAHQAS